MREYFLSNCEKSFLQKLIAEGHRLDGRQYNESRKLQLAFGSDWGSCLVSLGNTKVLAQVSCEVVQPKQIRPNEGLLHVNVELSPMAAPGFEAGRQTDLSVYITRLLEKCFKDSRCVDLESLCIVVEEKVWSLRVDIRVLNHEGNLIECASIAALSSLAHFKRPDVTRSGDSVTIHTLAERDPIPTVLYHYPVCVTFGIFANDVMVSDPSLAEEAVCGGDAAGALLAVGMNQYRELCLLNLSGAAAARAQLLQRAAAAAAARTKQLVDTIKMAIVEDDNLRLKRTKVNFGDTICTDGRLSLSQRELSIRLKNFVRQQDDDEDEDVKEIQEMEESLDDTEADDTKYKIVQSRANTAKMESNPPVSKWIEVSSDSEEN